ncbi:hypothetical protein AB0N06_23520 [Streptomyces sp. NPDC051020]|uniref:hypothetical protein n=1 Tax=Streptomyces sp. NPDC051020 TaxID=3155409 RepID=UPI0034365825
MVLADRGERLRKELAGIDGVAIRLEAAKVVIGQFIDAVRSGQANDPALAEELERVSAWGRWPLSTSPGWTTTPTTR